MSWPLSSSQCRDIKEIALLLESLCSLKSLWPGTELCTQLIIAVSVENMLHNIKPNGIAKGYELMMQKRGWGKGNCVDKI